MTDRTVLGQSKIFTPEVINDIHMKAELGRYRMRGFSVFKKMPHWDELIFLPGTLTRFVIEGYREKCVTKTVLGARFAQTPSRSRRRWRWRRAPRWRAPQPARARAE
jgi:methylamine---glutamate N-methyltransferase subunit C